ncbi:tyrosine-protein phosphatase [Aspergillus udagawae]|nr:tyrosine-protein phosphatase [Aspergillus udagawae]
MGTITATPVAPDLELADFIDLEIDQPIPSDALARVLSEPPFRVVEGVFNIRDLGQSGHPGIQPGLVYRSGLLSNVTEVGKSQLVSGLSLGAIFDLRSHRERLLFPPPQLHEQVKFFWQPQIGTPPPVNLSDFTANNGNDAYRDMYLYILESHVPIFKGLLTYIRDELNAGSAGEKKAILFHCHAGKDRTSVTSALLLGLAGVPNELIVRDYALTRVGIETEKEYLLRTLQQAWPECAPGAAGFKEFSAIKASYMMAFLEAVQVKYGGMERFAMDVIGMSKADVEAVRAVLRGES